MGILDELIVYVDSTFKHGDSTLLSLVYYVVLVIGAIKGSQLIFGVLGFLYQHFIRSRPDLYKRYADPSIAGGSWAVVTGASDGIGAEFCRQLARDGFNIALVSRTLSKLQVVEAECKKINPKIKTRVVQADFAGNTTLPFYEGLYKQLDDLDIAILINNAGVAHTGQLSERLTYEDLKSTLDVNVMHVALMCRFFVHKLSSRKIRSAIINTGSICGYFKGMMNNSIYTGTKAYVRFFTEGLAGEVSDRIDVQLLHPGSVKTKMSKDPEAIPVGWCVSSSLRDLGYAITTAGYWTHDNKTYSRGLLSEFSFVQAIIGKEVNRISEGE